MALLSWSLRESGWQQLHFNWASTITLARRRQMVELHTTSWSGHLEQTSVTSTHCSLGSTSHMATFNFKGIWKCNLIVCTEGEAELWEMTCTNEYRRWEDQSPQECLFSLFAPTGWDNCFFLPYVQHPQVSWSPTGLAWVSISITFPLHSSYWGWCPYSDLTHAKACLMFPTARAG